MMRIANVYPGRFNPPSVLHKLIIDNMLESEYDNYLFIIDGEKTSTNLDKNPLSYDDRKNIFSCYKGLKIDYASNIIDCLDILDIKGYTSINLYCGGDRYNSYKNISNNYYNNRINIICQERNIDISATKIRKLIRNKENYKDMIFPMSEDMLKIIDRKIYDSTNNTE